MRCARHLSTTARMGSEYDFDEVADCSSMENTEKTGDSIVTLPCFTGITDEELETTVNAVKKALNRG